MNGTTNDDDDVETGASVSLTDPVSGAEGELVEILPGLVAVCGGIDLEALDGVETPGVDTAGASRFLDCVSETVAGANLLVQGTYSLVNFQGLVKFAPETLQALKSAQTVTKGGWNLGTLTCSGGKFVHQVRWVPATGAQAVTVLAGLGPAAALLAIGTQMSALSRRLRTIENQFDRFMEDARERDNAKLGALLNEVCKVVDEVSRCGLDTVAVRTRIANLDSRDLDEQYLLYVPRAQAPEEDGDNGGAKQVKLWRSVGAGLTALVAISWACDTIGVLKVLADAAAGVESAVRASRVRELQNDLEKRRQEVDEIVSSVQAQAHLLLLENERKEMRFLRSKTKEMRKRIDRVSPRRGNSNSDGDVLLDDVVGAIDEVAVDYWGPRAGAPDPSELETQLEVQDGEPGDLDLLRRALHWCVPWHEEFLALVQVKNDGTYVFVSNEHWGLLSPKNISVGLAGRQWNALEDVRYVVDSGQDKSGRKIRIVTPESIEDVTFVDVEAGTVRAAAVDRVVSLLRTAMNLPEGERGKDPLLLQPAPVC